MTAYAKTWCPAYPCDPCLVQSPLTTDNIGSGGDHVVYNYHEGDTQYFLGVRKWGLIIDTVAASFGLPQTDPPQFCIPVNGAIAIPGGPTVPLSDLTLTYGGSIVFRVSGSIHVMTTGPVDSNGVYGFSGYVEVPADGLIQISSITWEWHYDDVFQPGAVTLQWDLARSGSFLYSTYAPETAGLTFYRTGIQEMPSSVKRSELGHRLPLIRRFQSPATLTRRPFIEP